MTERSMQVALKSYIKSSVQKKSLLTLLFFTCFYCCAQVTFSTKFDLGFGTLANALFETNDGYLVSGSGFDSTNNIHVDFFIRKINKYGVNLSMFHVGEENMQFFARSKTHGTFADGTHIKACLQLQPGPNECRIFWFNNEGDTISSMHFPSPALDLDEFIEVRDLVVDPVHDCFYLSLGVYRPDTQNDYVIQKRSKEGELIWEVYTDGPQDEGSICLIVDGTGIVIIESGAVDNEYYRMIKKMTHEGAIAWSFLFESEDSSLGPRDMLLENDGLVCSTIGSPPDTLYSSPILLKLDTLGNILWLTHTPNSYTDHFQFMENVVKTCDGGYIGAATKHIPQVEGDTLNATQNYLAWLIRYDHDGNILWDQKYAVVNSLIYHHEIYDLITTSDGGILFAGEAIDRWYDNPNFEAPAQQAWVVKLDACGCLVPGCNPDCIPPDCTESIAVPEGDYFLYGPNPVSQILNIYVGENASVNTEFRMYDMRGRMVKSFISSQTNITYMWDLSELSTGIYTLSLFDGKNLLQTEKIVKE